MKSRHLIIATLLFLFFASCNWGEWFRKPFYHIYIPDSLKFQYNTGDTMIFRCLTDSTVIYDTFRLGIRSEMEPIISSDFTHAEGEEEIIFLDYNGNNNRTLELEIDHTGYIKFNYINNNRCICYPYRSECTLYTDIALNNTIYHNVYYSPACSTFYYDIYRNVEKGLISYTNAEGQTYYLYKYIPTN